VNGALVSSVTSGCSVSPDPFGWVEARRSRVPPARSVVAAAALAATLSGVPSTGWAWATGGDVLAAARAAGTVVHPRRSPGSVVEGALVHAGLSLGWTLVLAVVLPAGRRTRWGAAAGVLIAGLDLGLVGRRLPAIRALPVLPQLADHVAFGVLVGASFDRSAAGPVDAGRRQPGAPLSGPTRSAARGAPGH
jgi:hypothetical protein